MSSPDPALFYPMFAMMVLSTTVLVRLRQTRMGAFKRKAIDASYFKTMQGADDPAILQAERNFANLFELPVLFYVACLLCMHFRCSDTLTLVLSWSYVGSRFVHSFIHITSNVAKARIVVYSLSLMLLHALWVRLLVAVAWSI